VPYRSTGKDQQVESTVGSHNDAFYLSKYAPSELQISNSKILMNTKTIIDKQITEAKAFNITFKSINDVLSSNTPDFSNWNPLINPKTFR
jgi:hypothetical protein